MNVLVTGGGGFLGGAIVRRLLDRGHHVRSFQRGEYAQLAAWGVELLRGDLADAEAVDRAVAGCELVFHVAAKAGVWGPHAEYYRANVLGTQNVIAACRHHGVTKLIYTSSPSVVFNGHDENGIDESAPYPSRHLAHYGQTKAEAERLVLAANGASLATVALRPHLIFGPGDPHLVPRIVARARAGRLRLIGRGDNLVDCTYIDNAADAHLLAADAVAPGSACAGKAYFISNGEPLPIAELVNRILAAAHRPPVRRAISPQVAYAIGALLELIYGTLRLRAEPLLTRFVVRQLATAHWFDLTAAHRDLGYRPLVPLGEAFRRLEESLHRQPA